MNVVKPLKWFSERFFACYFDSRFRWNIWVLGVGFRRKDRFERNFYLYVGPVQLKAVVSTWYKWNCRQEKRLIEGEWPE